ncbi:hypothetical protein ZPR_4110 [Zunongwangia profunda SM-A87]|uniref:Uncharacterized protein n=1 Tax=Zunongwangia profunda (strain DSM 18752 / CCTCC AB 206139 / SM-A87) TaxID=655815 RepID=D5BA88_ZUNPS|nr:hypothetical protein ZPR_4110 [Zunongwangia profunda SM-A87]
MLYYEGLKINNWKHFNGIVGFMPEWISFFCFLKF